MTLLMFVFLVKDVGGLPRTSVPVSSDSSKVLPVDTYRVYHIVSGRMLFDVLIRYADNREDGADGDDCGGMSFAISSPMQLLLLKYSSGGELMGGAAVQIAFNLGNAIGATVGGIALAKLMSEGGN